MLASGRGTAAQPGFLFQKKKYSPLPAQLSKSIPTIIAGRGPEGMADDIQA
jgi:hypothetical protein